MRSTRWLGGGILLAATAILAMISQKFLFDAAAQSAARGINLTTPLAVTIVRVGFGGFPLASAIITAVSLLTGQVRRGLGFVVVLFGTVLLVRVVSGAANGSLAASLPLIAPELVFVALSAVVLVLGKPSASRAIAVSPRVTP